MDNIINICPFKCKYLRRIDNTCSISQLPNPLLDGLCDEIIRIDPNKITDNVTLCSEPPKEHLTKESLDKAMEVIEREQALKKTIDRHNLNRFLCNNYPAIADSSYLIKNIIS